MKANLFENGKKYSRSEVQNILRANNRKRVRLFFNVFGWDCYYTTEPTFATPTGVLKDFPRVKQISVD